LGDVIIENIEPIYIYIYIYDRGRGLRSISVSPDVVIELRTTDEEDQGLIREKNRDGEGGKVDVDGVGGWLRSRK